MSGLTILSDENLQEIYTWVDSVPLSRPKRNITRDFSDGVMMAEILGHYFPKDVDIKNYSAANSVRQKLYNWQTLINKVRAAHTRRWKGRVWFEWQVPPARRSALPPTHTPRASAHFTAPPP